jgi:hypothetical protein
MFGKRRSGAAIQKVAAMAHSDYPHFRFGARGVQFSVSARHR